MMHTVAGTIVDVWNNALFNGKIVIVDGRIAAVERTAKAPDVFIVPGLVDAHIHIESSMLPPSEFARIAAVHGTVATVSDPHEIGNVLGIEGVRFMIEDARKAPIPIYYGAPSCVPATTFETSGALLGPAEVDALMQMDQIRCLAEVMNVPGVLTGDRDLMAKIRSAQKYSKPIDGHAPGLRGKELATYLGAGISTDHECLSREEAREKLQLGMNILIREGSAARNFDDLIPLADEYYNQCMFCSDDQHPDDLIKGYINEHVKRALRRGMDIMKVLTIASVNPVTHYGLDVGMLRKGDWADFLVIDTLQDFTVLRTYVHGRITAEDGRSAVPHRLPMVVNNFAATKKDQGQFALPARGSKLNVIEAIDGQLITNHLVEAPTVAGGLAVSDPERDLLKIVVVNRYHDALPAIGFVRNIGLKKGAIASSVAHDSHNIIAVGVTDEEIGRVVNTIIDMKGGICAVSDGGTAALSLPIAGLMSTEEYGAVARKYTELDALAKSLGSPLRAPFMTVSFLALPVIPSLKLSDQGLFDGEAFRFIDVFTS